MPRIAWSELRYAEPVGVEAGIDADGSHASSTILRPLGAAGAVFERDADGGEAVADRVAGGEVFGGAGVGAELDQAAS